MNPIEAKQKAQNAKKPVPEEEKRKHRCCFTGHRPQGLKRPIDDIRVDLENTIIAAIKEGYTTFITGMCYGTDIWAGEIVNRLKDRFPELKLIAAVPYPDFPEQWDPYWKGRYLRLLRKADAVRFLSTEYADSVFQTRNEWMVSHSSKVIAVSNGQKSGTLNTIRYARKQKIPVDIIRA